MVVIFKIQSSSIRGRKVRKKTAFKIHPHGHSWHDDTRKL